MTIEERVARAICAIEEPTFDPGADDDGKELPLWQHYYDAAVAAIAAIRAFDDEEAAANEPA